MSRFNVIFIMGNHDFMMYSLMNKFAVEITENNFDCQLTTDDLRAYSEWLQDGGNVTAEQFRKLTKEEQSDILDYLSEAFIYQIIEDDNKKYILVHAGLGNFSEEKNLEDYELYELLEDRADYSKRYFKDKNMYLITGHTPTPMIEEWRKPEVYTDNGHIAIDCGCVSGGKLAVYCFETRKTAYVDAKSKER